MRTKYLISLKLLLQVFEFVCSIARLKNKIREETQKGRDVMLLQLEAVIFAFLVLPRFFLSHFPYFSPIWKQFFIPPFALIARGLKNGKKMSCALNIRRLRSARRLKAKRKSYIASISHWYFRLLTVYVNLGNHGLTLLSYSAYHCLTYT